MLSQAGVVALLCAIAALAAVLGWSLATGDEQPGTLSPGSAVSAIGEPSPTASGSPGEAAGPTPGGPDTSAVVGTTSIGGSNPASPDTAVPRSSVPSSSPSGPNATAATGATAASQLSRCTDGSLDDGAEGLADIDLIEVTLSRTPAALMVRFTLRGPVVGATSGSVPASSSWQVLMAQGNEIIYALTVTTVEGVWETSLVDFGSPEGDRFAAMAPPTGASIEAIVAAKDLVHLPAQFTWWATSTTDRLVSQGLFASDDCPSGSGLSDGGLALPPESRRARFGG